MTLVSIVNHDISTNLRAGPLLLLRGQITQGIDVDVVDEARKSAEFSRWLEEGRVEILREGKTYRESDPDKPADQRDFAGEEAAKRVHKRRQTHLATANDALLVQYKSLLATGHYSEMETVSYLANFYGLDRQEVKEKLRPWLA